MMEYDLKELIEVYKEKIKSDLYRIEDLRKEVLEAREEIERLGKELQQKQTEDLDFPKEEIAKCGADE